MMVVSLYNASNTGACLSNALAAACSFMDIICCVMRCCDQDFAIFVFPTMLQDNNRTGKKLFLFFSQRSKQVYLQVHEWFQSQYVSGNSYARSDAVVCKK